MVNTAEGSAVATITTVLERPVSPTRDAAI
jgi:hypothetical protein